ncbi:MAG: HEAT repeat domain-containing protein [bacterium]
MRGWNDWRTSRELTPATTLRGSRAAAGIAVFGCVAIFASSGCMQRMDPKQARAEFSSKDQSIATAQSAGRPTASLPPVGTGPVTLAPPAAVSGTETSAREASELARLQLHEAQSLLRAAARSSWAALRAHAIEASTANPALLVELAPAGLADENRGVRFVTCMAIAREPSEDLAVLVQPLVTDESESVRASALLALSRCGKKVDPGPIAAMAFSNNPEVRANAYLVLGEMGNRSAVPLIYDSLTKGLELVNPVRVRLIGLAASEALVKLGEAREIEPIRAALFAPPEQSELTVVACGAIGRLKDEVARPMLERLLTVSGEARRSPEIRLSAATALMELGGNPKLAVAIAQEYLGNGDPRIRAVVAVLLGKARCPEATTILTNLIRDTDPTVQVAAAAGLEAVD